MKLPQIIRFADYLKENPAEAVRTVLYQDQHDNMVPCRSSALKPDSKKHNRFSDGTDALKAV